jgi:hypothetical protein
MDIPIYLFSMVIKKKFCRRAGMGRLPYVAAGLAGGGGRLIPAVPTVNPLLRKSPYGIKRAHFKQSNPHIYRHVRLGAALEPYL